MTLDPTLKPVPKIPTTGNDGDKNGWPGQLRRAQTVPVRLRDVLGSMYGPFWYHRPAFPRAVQTQGGEAITTEVTVATAPSAPEEPQ